MDTTHTQLYRLALAVSMLMISFSSDARTYHVKQGKNGLELVEAAKQKVQPKAALQETKQNLNSKTALASKVLHTAVKDYGLFVASVVIPFIVPDAHKGCLNPLNGALFGAAAGSVYATVNDTKLVDSVVTGATLGCFTGAGMAANTYNDYFKGIVLRTTHGALLDMSSTRHMAEGALCGAAQGISNPLIEKLYDAVPGKAGGADILLLPATLFLLTQQKNVKLPSLTSVTTESINTGIWIINTYKDRKPIRRDSYDRREDGLEGLREDSSVDYFGRPDKAFVKLAIESLVAVKCKEIFAKHEAQRSQTTK